MAKKSRSKASASKTATNTKGARRTISPKAISKKARQAGTLKALESVSMQGLSTTKSGQRKASAALKANRLAMKGLTTRRAGHSQAQTGRSQARRDERNASR